MKKLLLLLWISFLLTGCTKNDKLFSECVLKYEPNNPYCSSEEQVNAFKDVIGKSMIMDDEFGISSVVMLNEETIYVRASHEGLLDQESLKDWVEVLDYVRDQLDEGDYTIDLVLSDTSYNYILSFNNDETVAILVIEMYEEVLNEHDIQTITNYLTMNGISDKRIRYGHVLTGDDIYIADDSFIVDSLTYEEIDYFMDSLEDAFTSYKVVKK